MKALFIGPYKQADGWGEAARAFIYSLMTTGIDLTIRPIFLAGGLRVHDNALESFEIKNNEHYDVIIQHTLPEHFHWVCGSRNIGFCLIETSNINFTPWIASMNLMDEIWLSSNSEFKSLRKSGCTIPIEVIGEATNIHQFFKSYPLQPHQEFNFYTIGNGERKNFYALLLAFHREFDRNEPVNLIIKTDNADALRQNINSLKQQWALYKNLEQYKQEIIIDGRLSDEDMCSLHVNNDCFVMPSFGEGWCRPALDALGFGKTPIVTDNTGMVDFINNQNGWVVPSRETPVTTVNRPIQYIYTSRETWFEIDILGLQKAMREAYTNKAARQLKASQGLRDIAHYSYESIGLKIKKLLEKK